jgi:hypothetical protein
VSNTPFPIQVRRIARLLAAEADIINGPAAFTTHQEALIAYRSHLQLLIEAAQHELSITPVAAPR